MSDTNSVFRDVTSLKELHRCVCWRKFKIKVSFRSLCVAQTTYQKLFKGSVTTVHDQFIGFFAYMLLSVIQFELTTVNCENICKFDLCSYWRCCKSVSREFGYFHLFDRVTGKTLTQFNKQVGTSNYFIHFDTDREKVVWRYHRMDVRTSWWAPEHYAIRNLHRLNGLTR